jgi:hypothetical protein
MAESILRTLTIAAATSAAGCHAFAPVPPTSIPALLETPETVAEGSRRASVTGAAVGALLGPNMTAGAASMTWSLGERTDVALSPTVQDYGNPSGRIEGYRAGDSLAYGVDARLKVRPFDTEHVAFFGGVGGAVNRRATFVTASAGASFAYVNRHLVPFLDLVAYAGAPIASEAFVYRSSATSAPRTLEATSALGGLASAGLAWPVTAAFDLRVAGAVGWLVTAADSTQLVGLAMGAGYTY